MGWNSALLAKSREDRCLHKSPHIIAIQSPSGMSFTVCLTAWHTVRETCCSGKAQSAPGQHSPCQQPDNDRRDSSTEGHVSINLVKCYGMSD